MKIRLAVLAALPLLALSAGSFAQGDAPAKASAAVSQAKVASPERLLIASIDQEKVLAATLGKIVRVNEASPEGKTRKALKAKMALQEKSLAKINQSIESSCRLASSADPQYGGRLYRECKAVLGDSSDIQELNYSIDASSEALSEDTFFYYEDNPARMVLKKEMFALLRERHIGFIVQSDELDQVYTAQYIPSITNDLIDRVLNAKDEDLLYPKIERDDGEHDSQPQFTPTTTGIAVFSRDTVLAKATHALYRRYLDLSKTNGTSEGERLAKLAALRQAHAEAVGRMNVAAHNLVADKGLVMLMPDEIDNTRGTRITITDLTLDMLNEVSK